jgi:hypothetical protein
MADRKQRIAVMLGFKGFRNAATTIAGIELLQRSRGHGSDPRRCFGRPRALRRSQSGTAAGSWRQRRRTRRPRCSRSSGGSRRARSARARSGHRNCMCGRKVDCQKPALTTVNQSDAATHTSEPLAQPSPDRVKGNTHTITRKAVVGIDAPLTAGTLSGVGSASRPLSPITSDGPVTGNCATGSR